jgi:hypothetical protein
MSPPSPVSKISQARNQCESRWQAEPYLAYFLTWKMETTCSSETSVDFQWTTWRYIPEDRTLYISLINTHIYYLGHFSSSHFSKHNFLEYGSELKMMDNVKNNGYVCCDTPLSETFRLSIIYLLLLECNIILFPGRYAHM